MVFSSQFIHEKNIRKNTKCATNNKNIPTHCYSSSVHTRMYRSVQVCWLIR